MKRLKYLAMAALVAFAACDEGEEVVTVPPPVTGTISGSVTISDEAQSGVTVSLSNGESTTTSANGTFAFAEVQAGSYTVSIPQQAGATFQFRSASALITAASQNVQVDFSGEFIETASVSVSVAGSDGPLGGVLVTLSGPENGSQTTGQDGTVVFTGLRAGSYSASISGFDGSQYDFGVTSQSITLGVGDTGSLPFTGMRRATGQIIGGVTIDDSGYEGATVTVRNGSSTQTAESGTDGRFAFGSLLPGDYTVEVSVTDPEIVFSSQTAQTVTIAQSGDVEPVDFVGSFVGTGSIAGSVLTAGNGVAGVTVSLSAGPTAKAAVTTDANGEYAAFTGLLSGDYVVTISGFDAAQNQFVAVSQPVEVGVGEAKSANFRGTIPSTSVITGMVMVDGNAAANATVTLTPEGATTGIPTQTNAQGVYTYNSIPVGNHTVTVTPPAADVIFPNGTELPARVTAAGQTVTVNFSGNVRFESTISGSVTSDEGALAGVTVTVTGGMPAVTRTTTTGTAGQFNVDQLRAGDYTVAISGYDTNRYDFSGDATSKPVTVGIAASEAVDFTGEVFKTSTITGRFYIDTDGDDMSGGMTTEPTFTQEPITVTIVGGDVADTQTTTTVNGVFTFSNLAPGNYNVTADASDFVSGTYTLGDAALVEVRGLAVAGTQSVDYPVDIVTQTVNVRAGLGVDASLGMTGAPAAETSPLNGVSISLYDTQANAQVCGATGRLGGPTATGSGSNDAGEVSFTFARANDISPQGGRDNIVFACFVAAPAPTASTNFVQNGETVVEINYDSGSAMFDALDAFDFLNNIVSFSTTIQEIDQDALSGWPAAIFPSTGALAADTAAGAAGRVNIATNASGVASYTVANAFATAPATAFAPATFWVRAPRTAGGFSSNHAFTTAPMPAGTFGTVNRSGSTTPEFIQVQFNGTELTTVDAGSLDVRYSDATLYTGSYRERDDVEGDTAGDGFDGAAASITRTIRNASNAVVQAAQPGNPADGQFPPVNVSTGTTSADYSIIGGSNPAFYVVLNPSTVTVTVDGADSAVVVAPNGTGTESSAIAYKGSAASISGVVTSEVNGAFVPGLTVTAMPASNNIQGTPTQTTTTANNGSYGFTGLVEGPYNVMIEDSNDWVHEVTVTGNNSPNDGDVNPNGNVNVAINFTPRFQNTTIRGQIANDRDDDGTDLESGQTLASVTIDVFEDINRDGDWLDAGESTSLATVTSDANGRYEITPLKEGNYRMQATSAAATVLTAVTGTGAANTFTPGVITRSGTPVFGTVPSFPRWDYDNSTLAAGGASTLQNSDFTFLFQDGTINATFTNGGNPVNDMTVTVRRCITSAGSTSPPAPGGGACTTYDTSFGTGGQLNLVTDASGMIQAPNLREGVYEVRPSPTTAGLTTSTPASTLFLLDEQGDAESFTFPIT